MNALKCEGPGCDVWTWPDENDGWLSLGRADWPEAGGRWEHEHYFCSLPCLDGYVWHDDQQRETIKAEVAEEERREALAS